MDSLEHFVSDIQQGRWDVVLPQVAQLKLPRAKLEDLYEQARAQAAHGAPPRHAHALPRSVAHMHHHVLTLLRSVRNAHTTCARAQVVLEMAELREGDTARAMLRQTQVFQRMKVNDGGVQVLPLRAGSRAWLFCRAPPNHHQC